MFGEGHADFHGPTQAMPVLKTTNYAFRYAYAPIMPVCMMCANYASMHDAATYVSVHDVRQSYQGA